MSSTLNMSLTCGISCTSDRRVVSRSRGRKFGHSPSLERTALPTRLRNVYRLQVKMFASRKSEKKVREDRKTSKNFEREELFSEYSMSNATSSGKETNTKNLGASGSSLYPSRRQVLHACVVTSGLLVALAAIIRLAVHVAFVEGWTSFDTSEVSFNFEMWHWELVLGLVVLISSSRFILLKTWPDFSRSSEVANQQILSSLAPLDYVVVAFLPGISEELLFRGALLPLFGFNWISAFVVGAIFGVLHVGSGRRYSFALWATFVGFAYGVATISSSSIIVPVASHSLNNLVAGLLWRQTSCSKQQDRKDQGV